jgi:putative chitinase
MIIDYYGLIDRVSNNSRALIYAPLLEKYAVLSSINTPLRLAHFVAQIAHESAHFIFTRELWGDTPSQKRYEANKNLGNFAPGDGRRFLGRGLIQITGRFNTEEMLKQLNKDLTDYKFLESYEGAMRSACVYWEKHGLNELADKSGTDVSFITRKINGGYNGLKERKENFDKLMSYLAENYAND